MVSVAVGICRKVEHRIAHCHHYYRSALAGQTLASNKPICDNCVVMPRDRIELEQLEYKALAPYAQKAADSRGRAFPEPKHGLRTDFQRDRDRIIHSRAF